MKVFARRLFRRLAIGLAALLLLFLILHTPLARRGALRLAVFAIEKLSGGVASIGSLDYRLWRGEIRASSIRYRLESFDVSADEVEIHVTPLGPPEVRVQAPKATFTVSRGSGGSPSIPSALLRTRFSIVDGSIQLEWPEDGRSLAISSIQAKLEPGIFFSTADVDAASALLRDEELEMDFGPLNARLELSLGGIRIDEARIEKAGSFVSASGTLEELRFEHSIDGALLAEIDPRLAVAGIVEGEGTLSLSAEPSGEGVLRATALRFQELPPVAIEASWKLAGDHASADLSFETLDPRMLAPLSSRVTGRISLQMEEWDGETARGEGRVSLQGVGRAGIPLTGDVALRLEAGKIAFDAPRLTAPGLSLRASGSVGDELGIEYRGRIQDLSAMEYMLAPPIPVRGALDFEGTVTGPLGSPRIQARILSPDVGVGSASFSLEGDLAFRGSRLEVSALTLRHAAGGSTLIAGEIPTKPKAGPWNLSARVDELELRGLSEALTSGTMSGTAAVTGEFSTPEVDLEIETSELETAGGLRARVRGEARTHGMTGDASLTFEKPSFRGVDLPGAFIALHSDGSTARILTKLADGREILAASIGLASPYPIEAETPLENLPFAEIRELFPALVEAGAELEIEGRARVDAELSDLENLRYRMDVERILGVYRGIALGATSHFSIEGTRESFAVTDLTLVGEDTAIGIDGVIPLSREGGVVVHARGATRLELLKPWFPEAELAGWANVDVHVEGALPDPWLRGELGIEGASGRFGKLRVSNVNARADWSDRVLRLESLSGEMLEGTFRVSGELPPQLADSTPARIRFEAEGLNPLALAAEEPAPEGEPAVDGPEVRVAISGELSGAGADPTRWSGGGELTSVHLRLRDFELENERPAPWSLSEGAVALSELRFASGPTLLVVQGEGRPLDEPPSWTVRASGKVDHEISRLVLAELGLSLTGVTDVDLRVSSDPSGEEPFLLEGKGTFEGARLAVREPAIAFTNVAGALELSGDDIRLTRLTADAGGGKVEAEGTLTLDGTVISNLDLRMRADSVRLNYPDGLRSEIAGSFRLSGSSNAMKLAGEASLGRALFSRDINVETQILQSVSSVARLASPGGFASRVALDLRVRASDAFRIDNNLARMEASVNMAVAGTLETPELSGNVSVRQGGRFRFGGNTYRVESGRIQFRRYPAEPPEIDITARTSVAEYDVQLVLRGSTDDLGTTLTSPSHPELSRGDVASLLLTGRTLSEISGEGRTLVGERMASYLGSTLADLAQLGIGQVLPFDIVTVEPALIAGEADPGARFTLGAQLTEDLSLVYSIGLNDTDDQIWVVDYKLPASTRGQIVRDQDNEFSFGLAQELRFDLHQRSQSRGAPRPAIAEISLTIDEEAPEVTETDLRGRLKTKPGRDFDYWKAWEDSERLREYLRDRGYLEAIVDVSSTVAEAGGVAIVYKVERGPRIRFEYQGDEPDSSLKGALRGAWNGSSGDSFLTSDLSQLASRKLYEQRYYNATAEVTTERSKDEVIVRIELHRGPRGKNVQVDITGNDSLSDSILLKELPKPGSAAFYELITAKRPRLKQILALRYASEGFVTASVGDLETSFDGAEGSHRITIPVVEGKKFFVEDIELEGVSSVSEAELRSRITLRENEPFRVTALVKDRSAIAAYYRDHGHPDVAVDSVVVERPGTSDLDVKFVVNEGPRASVGDVQVVGNEQTRESVILRAIEFEKGDPLSLAEVNKTERRLHDLGIFQSAEVVVDETGASGEARDLRIQVNETKDLEFEYGARASTGGFFEVVTEIRSPNLFGRAQHVGLRTLIGTERQIFRFSYHTPYLSSYRLDTDFFLERARIYEGPEPIEGSEQMTIPFTEDTWTFTAQQTRALVEDDLTLQWSYSYDRTVTEVEDFLGSVFVQNNHIFNGSLIGDYRDSVVRPTRGSLWSASVQAAPEALGSDLKMVLGFGQLFTYVSLGPVGSGRIVWAGGYRVGAGTSFGEDLDQKYGFRAGGPNSVRGFEQASLGPVDPFLLVPLGGTGLLVFNQEIRFPLFWKLGGVAFYDAGNAFKDVSDIRFSELRQNVGLGARFELPFGLIRLDWARVVEPRPGESPWRFVFSLGNAF